VEIPIALAEIERPFCPVGLRGTAALQVRNDHRSFDRDLEGVRSLGAALGGVSFVWSGQGMCRLLGAGHEMEGWKGGRMEIPIAFAEIERPYCPVRLRGTAALQVRNDHLSFERLSAGRPVSRRPVLNSPSSRWD
jgi:hypothetical protein